VRELST